MKRIALLLTLLLLTGALSACAKAETAETTKAATIAETTAATAATTEDKEMNKITITVGDAVFDAELYDNEAAEAFAARLPLTLTMQELHGNEKYYYFDSALPSEEAVPDRIESGDIKLYGSDCLVLFYDSFTTTYSYTDIGRINNPDGLKEALGAGEVAVTFAMKS